MKNKWININSVGRLVTEYLFEELKYVTPYNTNNNNNKNKILKKDEKKSN